MSEEAPPPPLSSELTSDDAARQLLQQQVSYLNTGLFSSPISTASLRHPSISTAGGAPLSSIPSLSLPPDSTATAATRAAAAAPPLSAAAARVPTMAPAFETPAPAGGSSSNAAAAGNTVDGANASLDEAAAAAINAASQPGATPGTLKATLDLLEARAQGAASLAALSSHAAQLETQLRAQASASARAEAARAEAVSAQAALAHDVATLTQEKQRITAQLDHYMARSDELIAERGAGAAQLAELARTVATEREAHSSEVSELRERVAQLEAAQVEADATNHALETQNAALHADLSEVTKLIDQLEGEPGYVRARLYKRSSPVKKEKQLQHRKFGELSTRAEGLEVEVESMRAELRSLDAELQGFRDDAAARANGGGWLSAIEAGALREENRILESQLELLSEKMYGSPAKSAAKERDRLQIELERERAERMHQQETVNVLHAELERAHARVAELMAQLHVDEHTRADLERTRRALRAAQTNAALGLMAGKSQPARAYNPIAAPRHQFGDRSGQPVRASTPTVGMRPSSASVRGPSPGRASFGPTGSRAATPRTGLAGRGFQT